MKFLNYKGYTGSIEYSPEDNLLFGKVLGVKGLISYEGHTGEQLEKDFKHAVDSYLSLCNQEAITPDRPFKGSFNVRLSPELHQKAALRAIERKVSLNSFVAESIREKVHREMSGM